MKAAIIGIGRWGRNIAREASAVCDLAAYVHRGSPETEKWAKAQLPRAISMTLEEVCSAQNVSAAFVSTSVASHAPIARQLLASGKHVFVEKPAALSSGDAGELSELAAARGLIFMTGYIFLHNPVYEEFKRRAQGKTRRLTLMWDKYGTFREDIAWSLLTHHVAVAQDLLGRPLGGKMRRGQGFESDCDEIEMRLLYPDAEALSLISRHSSRKRHVITAELEHSTLVWEDNALFETLPGQLPVAIFASSVTPLEREIRAFLSATQGGPSPLTAGNFGKQVLVIHEMLEEVSRR